MSIVTRSVVAKNFSGKKRGRVGKAQKIFFFYCDFPRNQSFIVPSRILVRSVFGSSEMKENGSLSITYV